MQCISNCNVFDGEQLLEGRAVLIDAGLIVDIVAADVASSNVNETIDLGGQLLAPGLIDLQVNGGGGVLFNDEPQAETLATMGSAHRRYGTTAFLPTLISDDANVMTRGINAVSAAMEQNLAGVIGIHLEGPHLNAGYCGVHDANKFRPLDRVALSLLTALEKGCTLVTIAPELVDDETIRELVSAGLIVCGGHSAADYEQTCAALDAGMNGFTHLFNAMTPLTSRAPGMVGAALLDENSFFGIIADGHHVHPATLRLAIRTKATGKALLVTDAMPTVGGAGASFKLNGEIIQATDGRCLTPDGTLAGSNIGMIDAVRNARDFGGVDTHEALRMASRYPAAAIGLSDSRGFVQPGYRADLIALDVDLNVTHSWIAGDVLVYV